MAASRTELERELAILRVRVADAAAEGRADPSASQRLQDVQAELRALDVPPGTLPAPGAGLWSPLPLYETAPVGQPAPTSPPPPQPPAQPPPPPPKRRSSAELVARVRAALSGSVGETLDDVLSGSWRGWHKSRAWRLGMLFNLVRAYPHGAVNCIANGALRIVTGEGVPAPRVAGWDRVPDGLQTGAETPDAITGLTPGAWKLLAALAKLGTADDPVRIEELASQLPGQAHLEADLHSFVHPSRTRPLAVRSGDRFHATELALQLLRGECVLPLLLLNGFEGATTRVPPHPIAETLDAVLQRLELTGFTYAPNLVPDPRAFGVISRETVTSYLATGSGVVHWRARVVIEPDGAVLISDLTWPLGPAEVAERIEYVQGALGRLVGLCSVEIVGSSSVRVEVEHAHLGLGVWWELLSSGIVGRTWPVNLLVRDGEVVRRMTGVELIDAFVDRSLEALKANPEPPPVQLAWERAHAQEGVCVALRALDEVLAALSQPDAQQVLTHFPRPVLSDAARTLPARTSSDYSRGFTQAQAAHLVGMSDLGARNLADEDGLWLRLRAELEQERAHPRSTTPRARLRRQLLELRARFAEPRLTQVVDSIY